MKSLTKRMLAFAGVLALGLTFARAQSDGALLDALVKKGVLSDQEAEDIRASEASDYATTPAGKLNIGSYIKNITFYGDGRLRYDGLWQHNYQAQSQNVQDRYRYRIRLGGIYSYSDHLKAGFELTSGTADDTANQTMGATFTDASINVSRIYVQWAPTDWATFTGGKFANPWYQNTDTQWSNDLNPEGIAEVFNWTFPLDFSSPSTDPKAVAPAPSGQSISIGLTAMQLDYITSNQGINTTFSTSTPTLAPFIQNSNNVGIIAAQIPVEWKISSDMKAKVAPGFTFYTGGGNTDYQGGVPVNYTNAGTSPEPQSFYGTANSSSDPVFYSPKEADDLNVLSVPGEFDFKIGDIPVKVYEDFDWNVTGKQRVQNVFLAGGSATNGTPYGATSTTTATPAIPATTLATTTALTSGVGFGSVPSGAAGAAPGTTASTVKAENQGLGDNVAWAAGVKVGENKKKGDWSVLGEFRQVGLGAVDQNINGTDFADSYSNEQGVKASAVYNFTDFLTGTVTLYETWAYKANLYDTLNGLPNGATSGSANPANGTTQALVDNKQLTRVQVDIGWKF